MGSTSTANSSNADQYCLRWNDFQSNITTAFSDIRDQEDFLDVTLVADGQTARAHKLVLSACSPLFKSMLKKNTHPTPMIFLHGIRYVDVVAILNFMYQGEVNVNQEDLQTFLAAAEELRIRGLSDRNNPDQAGASSSTMAQHTIVPSFSGGDKARALQRLSGSSTPKSQYSSPGPSSLLLKSKSPSSMQHDTNKRPRGSPDDSKVDEEGSKRVKPDLEYGDGGNTSSEEPQEGGGPYESFGGYDSSLFPGGGGSNVAAAAALMAEEMSSSASAGQAWYQQQSAAAQLLHQQYLLAQQHQHEQQQQQASTSAARPVCHFCRKELKNMHSLNVHISRYHSETNDNCAEVICPVCERTYGNKYSLRTHMHLNHKDKLHLLPTAKKSTAGNKKAATATSASASVSQDYSDMMEAAGEEQKDESYDYE